MEPIKLTQNDSPSKFENPLRAEMQQHLEHFEKEMQKLRTGRASSSLVEDLSVVCYGSAMRLKDIASITVPEVSLIVVQPWDANNIEGIEKAIQQSELHVTPTNDGNLVRIPLPPMSAARREELVKTLYKKLEECKVELRGVRKEFNNIVRDSEKNKAISEDTAKRLQAVLQKCTDDFTKKADDLAAKKEHEIKNT
jgi:ribosome recycling factor